MPNLELSFHIHEKGFTGKSMRRGELIGHRDNMPKFTKRNFKEACAKIREWMMEYNRKVDELGTKHKCGTWPCMNANDGGCKCGE